MAIPLSSHKDQHTMFSHKSQVRRAAIFGEEETKASTSFSPFAAVVIP
jgi:hypothetical protein